MNFKIVGVFVLLIIAVVVAVKFSQPQEPPPATVNETAPTAPTVTTDSFVEVSQIVPAMSGMTKETRGIVTVLNESKDNVFFTVKDAASDKTIKAVMFAKTNRDDPERKEMLLKSRDNNSVVHLKGEIDIYKGELEIKVWQVYEK